MIYLVPLLTFVLVIVRACNSNKMSRTEKELKKVQLEIKKEQLKKIKNSK